MKENELKFEKVSVFYEENDGKYQRLFDRESKEKFSDRL